MAKKKETVLPVSEKEIVELVDRLGKLKAVIADANEEIERIKVRLLVSNIKEGSGKLFDVKFSTTTTSRVDWNRIKEDYELPLEKYTEVSESVRMTVTARK